MDKDRLLIVLLGLLFAGVFDVAGLIFGPTHVLAFLGALFLIMVGAGLAMLYIILPDAPIREDWE